MATTAQRHHLRALMDHMFAHRAQLDYPPHDVRGPADARTFRLTETQAMHVLGSPGGRLSMDCSEFVTELLHWVGCTDPNGLHYGFAGYTGTMLKYLPHYTSSKAAGVGALVVYGPGTGEHVAMVHTPDPAHGNPLLASHGRPGLDFVYLREESSWHKPPVTFLSIAHL